MTAFCQKVETFWQPSATRLQNPYS